MIALSSASEVLRAIDGAHDVCLASYILRPGRVAEALARAARRGAHVAVQLEARPYKDARGRLARANAELACQLRRSGATVMLVDSARSPAPPLHTKAAIVDGVAFFDDRNWNAANPGVILRDDSQVHVRALRASLAAGRPVRSPGFAIDKRAALALEQTILAGARTSVALSTESFGRSSVVFQQLRRLAARGVRCRLVVNRTERSKQARAAIAALERAGVDVRATGTNEKFCVSDGTRAWIGSANATSLYFDATQREWALRVRSPEIIAALERRFDAYWSGARPATTR